MSLDRALKVTAFDIEADRPRDGWQQEPNDHGREVWVRQYPGGYVGTVLLWDDGEATFTVEDQDGQTVTGGKSSRRGWAMDGADSASRRNLN